MSGKYVRSPPQYASLAPSIWLLAPHSLTSSLSLFPKLLIAHSHVQIAELKAEIAGIEEENAAKRAKLTEENESVRARGRGWREEEEEEVELSFDDSSVKRYECESVRRRVDMADLSKGVRGLAPIEDATYVDGNLKKIYSISFRPCGKLVAAAGHGGMAGIFGIGHGGAGGEDVLLSWKAHQGWIGDIQFGSQQKEDASSNLVLSTSNDKMVILWDINTAASAGRQVYIFAHTHTQTHTQTNTHMSVMYVCMYVCMYKCIHAYYMNAGDPQKGGVSIMAQQWGVQYA